MAYRWGFIGTGRIIPRFLGGFSQVEEAIPAAIWGRNLQKAQKIADEWGFEKAYDDFDRFLDEGKPDVIYNALVHPLHEEFSKKCLERKIPVLCEKPMAPCLAQEKRIVECARKNDTFLMEGQWTRMFPSTRQIMQWIAEGRIGKLVGLTAMFTIKAPPENTTDRLFAKKEGGGTLLDIAIYAISFSQMVFGGPPVEIASLADLSEMNGTDLSAGIVLKFAGGELATIFTTFKCEGKDKLTIYGSDGIIEMDEDFWRPRHVTLTYPDGIVDFNSPVPADGSVYGAPVGFREQGYHFEVKHVHECLEKGLKESPIITHQMSLDIIDTCDKIRRIWGVAFPFDEE